MSDEQLRENFDLPRTQYLWDPWRDVHVLCVRFKNQARKKQTNQDHCLQVFSAVAVCRGSE